MGLSTIFITVHARDTKDMGDYIEYPVNVSNILAYPPNNNDQHEKAKTRIDLNAAFLPEGQQSTGSQCTVYSSLFTKESKKPKIYS